MRRDGTCILFKPHSVVSKHFQIWAGSGTYLRIREQLSWNSELDEMKFAFRTWKLTASCGKDLNHSFLFRYITCYEHPLSSWNWPLNEQEVIYYKQMYVNKWIVSFPLNSEWVHWRAAAGCSCGQFHMWLEHSFGPQFPLMLGCSRRGVARHRFAQSVLTIHK